MQGSSKQPPGHGQTACAQVPELLSTPRVKPVTAASQSRKPQHTTITHSVEASKHPSASHTQPCPSYETRAKGLWRGVLLQYHQPLLCVAVPSTTVVCCSTINHCCVLQYHQPLLCVASQCRLTQWYSQHKPTSRPTQMQCCPLSTHAPQRRLAQMHHTARLRSRERPVHACMWAVACVALRDDVQVLLTAPTALPTMHSATAPSALSTQQLTPQSELQEYHKAGGPEAMTTWRMCSSPSKQHSLYVRSLETSGCAPLTCVCRHARLSRLQLRCTTAQVSHLTMLR
jgi:hypothetical protein